jgi:hypothetical protein
MNEDVFNMSLRKFLKKVGVTSQREIEKAVRAAVDAGKLSGKEKLSVVVSLKIEGLELAETIDGRIELEEVARPSARFLDRPVARLVALGVALLCVAALAWLHRADLFPEAFAPQSADDPFARCFAGRAAEIDGMLNEGLIDQPRAELFKSRAEAMCRAETGGG